MDAYWQCEIPYPFVPRKSRRRRIRCAAACPTAVATPGLPPTCSRRSSTSSCLCDELGLNVLAIEHHAGINSLLGANPMLVGILARQTKKVRILSLGTLVSLREDPVRVAEEYATADVISRGRLDIGFVKSGGTEMPSANANPVRNEERYWEAIDLINKALTSQDGPFSWEGKHFTHRHVNIWPRPFSSRIRRCGRRPATRRAPPRSAGAACCMSWYCAGSRDAPRLRRPPPGARRGGIAAGHHRQFRLCRLRLCRRHRGGGRRVGEQALVVSQHQPQIGAAAFALHAGRVAARGRAADLPRPAAEQQWSRGAAPT